MLQCGPGFLLLISRSFHRNSVFTSIWNVSNFLATHQCSTHTPSNVWFDVACLLDVCKLCGATEGRLGYFLLYAWLRMGWQCDQAGRNPLKYSITVGDWTRATGRTDSEINVFPHWAIMADSQSITWSDYYDISDWLTSASSRKLRAVAISPLSTAERNCFSRFVSTSSFLIAEWLTCTPFSSSISDWNIATVKIYSSNTRSCF